MRRIFFRLSDVLTRLTSLMLTCTMIVMVTLGFFQVLTRFVLHEPSPWTEEILRRAMIWMVALGLPIGFRYGLHISVDIINRIESRTVNTFIKGLVFALTLAFLAVLIWLGADMAYRVRFQTFGSLDISMSWAYVAIPIGAALSAVSLIAHYISSEESQQRDRQAANFGSAQCQE